MAFFKPVFYWFKWSHFWQS